MRRTLFYLSVALLAFGIGSFVVFRFFWKSTEQPIIVSPNEAEISNNVNQTSETSQTNSDEDNFPTHEQFRKWQIDSFKPVIEKWLKGKKIIEREYDLERNDDYSSNSQEVAIAYLTDANGNGTKELALRTGCAIVGNCEFWLFQKSGKSYKIILEAQMVQRFRFLRNKTNRYFDLETIAHGSSRSGGIAIYKFDGNEYKIDKCFGYEYEVVTKKNGESVYSEDGQIVTKDKPTLTSASCEGWNN